MEFEELKRVQTLSMFLVSSYIFFQILFLLRDYLKQKTVHVYCC